MHAHAMVACKDQRLRAGDNGPPRTAPTRGKYRQLFQSPQGARRLGQAVLPGLGGLGRDAIKSWGTGGKIGNISKARKHHFTLIGRPQTASITSSATAATF